jgi:hypothetical protein
MRHQKWYLLANNLWTRIGLFDIFIKLWSRLSILSKDIAYLVPSLITNLSVFDRVISAKSRQGRGGFTRRVLQAHQQYTWTRVQINKTILPVRATIYHGTCFSAATTQCILERVSRRRRQVTRREIIWWWNTREQAVRERALIGKPGGIRLARPLNNASGARGDPKGWRRGAGARPMIRAARRQPMGAADANTPHYHCYKPDGREWTWRR